jgi:sugar/nucleoside kinase (ribokinase family)
VRICTLGDLLLDVVVQLDEPLVAGDDAPARTKAVAGGQAANVAAWAAELGAEARFVGKRADDAAGAMVAAQVAQRGVELAGPLVQGRTGVVVSLVGPDAERSLASDRGVATELAADELEAGWFADCDVLHVSGYSLLRDPIAGAAHRGVELARAAGARISVDASTWSAIRSFGPELFRERLAALAPDVVFASDRELEEIGAAGVARVVVVKRGAQGCSVLEGGAAEHHPALAVSAVDSTGAGDAFAAGFLVAGVETALEAAARCVGKLGALP